MLSASQRQMLTQCCDAVSFDVPMAAHSSLKAGGRAWALVEVADVSELRAVLAFCREANLLWRVLGRGSNILVRDQGFAGLLIRLTGSFKSLRTLPGGPGDEVIAGSGTLLAELLGWCRRKGLGGLEHLVGIPGSVGGAIRMNAGAFGKSIGECVHSLSLLDANGIVEEKMARDCHFGYRSFSLDGAVMEQLALVSVRLQLTPCPAEQIAEVMGGYLAERKAKQPGGQPSAGSFFKNPQGAYAGELIERAGLKGMRVGGALVSPLHANFIVNDGGQATAADIITLMATIQEKVAQQTGILLEPEVHIL